MANYAPNEIVDMILIVGECQRNYRAAARLYGERFPNRRHPSSGVIKSCVIRARQGLLHPHRGRQRSEKSEVLTLAAVAANPNVSCRAIADSVGVSRSTASRILRRHRSHMSPLKKRTETKVKEVVPKETEDKKVDVSEETATLPDDVPLANILSTITNDITPGLTTRSQSRLRANARGTSRDRPRGRRSSRRRGGSSATGHLNESTQDPDSDLEVVSVELPVVQVESLDDSLLKDSDWIDVANKSIDLTDENYEIDIKVLWRSKDIHRVNIQKNGNFANVFTYFAKLEGVTVEEILITKDEKAIKKTDTPASVNLSVIDILEGGIVKKGINPDSSSNNEINKDNRIIKVQTTAKKSLTVTVKKDENFSALFDKCAQDLEIDRSNIKLYFDGETVDENDTPDSLDVEDEACFDLRVTS